MYTLVKISTRPNTETPFFSLQMPYVKQLLIDLGITREETYSEDQLTQTVTLSAASQDAFSQLASDLIFQQHLKIPMQEYNIANGIASSTHGSAS